MLGGMEDPFICSVNFSQFSICRPVEQKKKKARKIELLSHLDHVVFLLWGTSKNVYLICDVINGSIYFEVTVLFSICHFSTIKTAVFGVFFSAFRLSCGHTHTGNIFWWWLIQYSYNIKVLPLISPWCYFASVSVLSDKRNIISSRVDAATQNSHH